MEAIILAGGFGTRLSKVVGGVPKPMAPIAERPFLEILLSMLARKGFTRVVLSLGFMSEKIIAHFGERYAGIDLLYETESLPLGTGGAVREALARCTNDHSFIFNGDTYLDIEADKIEHLWQTSRHPLIVVREVLDVTRFGSVEMRDGRIQRFLEKGNSGRGLINAGCYVLPKEILNHFPLRVPFSLETEFFAENLERMRFEGFVTHGQFIDIGIPEDYEKAQIELAGL